MNRHVFLCVAAIEAEVHHGHRNTKATKAPGRPLTWGWICAGALQVRNDTDELESSVVLLDRQISSRPRTTLNTVVECSTGLQARGPVIVYTPGLAGPRNDRYVI